MPVVPDNVTRAMCGIWVEVHSVNSPSAGTVVARAPRGSIGLGVMRGASYRSCNRTGALSNRLWSPPPPWLQWTTEFVPSSSWTSGALSFMACSTSRTASSGSYSTSIASAASPAWPRDSARTTATPSPWNRALSFVSGQ